MEDLFETVSQLLGGKIPKVNDVAVITGGGGDGIGFSLAKEIGKTGCSVALVDVREEALNKAQEELLGRKIIASTHVCDVRDREAVAELAREVLAVHGKVSILVNCAGVFGGSNLAKTSYEDIDRVLDINLKGTINVTKEFLPLLVREERPRILNVSSLDGLIAMPGALFYVTSKFAVTGFTRALQMDCDVLHPHLKVACVHPGFVTTSIIKNNEKFLDPDGLIPDDSSARGTLKVEAIDKFQRTIGSTSPDEAARQTLRGMMLGRTRIVVGNDAVILDLIARIAPSAFHHQYVFFPIFVVVLLGVRALGRKAFLSLLAIWALRRSRPDVWAHASEMVNKSAPSKTDGVILASCTLAFGAGLAKKLADERILVFRSEEDYVKAGVLALGVGVISSYVVKSALRF